jgi:hypothetical protein
MPAPPTDVDFADIADDKASDPEKPGTETVETVIAPLTARNVDPALERGLLRKMDFRLVPLVTVLCACPVPAAGHDLIC